MQPDHRFGLIAVCLALLLPAVACSSIVPPQTQVLAPVDPSIPRLLYVTTNGQREALLSALQASGFSITSDARETTLVLVVRFGGVRTNRPCGTLRNVIYDLRQRGARIAVIKARGWTGSCSPNILREMGAELARLFGTSL